MVDFSSVNLRILSPDGKNVLAELQTLDRVGQRTARNIGTAHKAAFTDMSHHGGIAARKLAGEIAMIAHEGAISARSMKQLAIEAGGLATLFGPEAAIASAVALTGVAIFNMFNRTREEMEKTRKAFQDELTKMVNAGDNAALMKQAQDLFRGTPANNFEDGIAALEARRAPLNAQFNNAAAANNRIMMRRLTEELGKIDVVLTPIQQKFNEISAAIRDINNTPLTIRGLPGMTTTAGPPMDTLDTLLFNQPLTPGIRKTPGIIAGVSEWRDSVFKALQKVPPLPHQWVTAELERLMAWDESIAQVGDTLGATLANGISAGIIAGIQGGGIGGAFRALTGTVLQSIGAMMQEIGTKALIAAKLFAKLLNWLALHPVAAIPVALGMIAFGATLSAAGASMGGRGGAGGGGGGGGYGGGGYGGGSSGVIDRGLINPINPLATSMASLQPRAPILFQPIIIGADDARAQRQVGRMLKNLEGRGG